MNTIISVKTYPSNILKNRGEFNLLISYEEVKKYIINKISDKKIKNNKTEYNNTDIELYIKTLLNNNIYSNLSKQTTINTLNYLFFHLRNSIYVEIRNNKVKLFQPFANAFYKNNWSHNIKVCDFNKNHKTIINNFINYKKKYFKIYQKYLMNKELWWSNNIIINNEDRPDIWGIHSLEIYKEILDETCNKYKINDVEFFINKRDHPLLKKDLTEPYDKLFPTTQKLNNIYQNQSYTPILSPYVDDKYLDIPFIIPEDWNLTKQNYEYKIQNNIKWEDKKNIAIFRGSATGYSDIKYNQRLQISKIKSKYIDAGITSFNSKDKIDINRNLTFIKPDELGIKLVKKIPMNEQIKYKYILSISGHSGGLNRISWILQSGSVWLKVKPLDIIDATDSWYSPLLKNGIHYIEIKEDFSDLDKTIQWCIDNDDKCKEIVNNAKKLYDEYFNKEKLLNYSAFILNSISNNFK